MVYLLYLPTILPYIYKTSKCSSFYIILPYPIAIQSYSQMSYGQNLVHGEGTS